MHLHTISSSSSSSSSITIIIHHWSSWSSSSSPFIIIAIHSFITTGFSGQQFYNDPILQLYNVMFTALPVMVVGIWDQMLPQKILQNNPAAFRAAKHKAFSVNVFTGWIAMGKSYTLTHNNQVAYAYFEILIRDVR